MNINERIFALLKEQNKTAKQLGEYIGVASSSISAWKNEGSFPSSKHIVPICEFLSISYSYLLTGKEDDEKVIDPKVNSKILLEYYNKMSPDEQKKITDKVIVDFLKQQVDNDKKSNI